MTNAESSPSQKTEETRDPSFLIFDTESIPDGRLVRLCKYPGENLTDEEAIQKAQLESRDRHGSDFLPVSFQVPVALCVIRVDADYRLQSIHPLGGPAFNPGEIARRFWQGLALYPRETLPEPP